MKKLLDLLEQKVQWIVLALGVAWVLYMAWSFLIQPPVKVEGVGSQSLGPSEVDAYINNTVVQDFERLKNTRAATPPTAPEVLAGFEARLNFAGANVESSESFARNNLPGTLNPPKVDLALLNGQTQPTPDGPVLPPGGIPVVAGQMDRAIEPPAPKITHTRNGMTNVLLVAANQGQQPGMSPVDKFWETTRYEIDMAALAKAFDAANVPKNFAQPLETGFMRVIVEREQLMPDGSWGNNTVVPPLITQLMQPFPADNAAPADFWNYLAWANQNTANILQPQFFQYVKGDPWGVPGEQIQDSAVAQFDPNQFVEWTNQQIQAHVPPFTNEQKRLIQKAKDDKRRQDAAGRRGGGAGGRPPPGVSGRGGMPGGGGIGSDYGPDDPGRPTGWQAIPPPGIGGRPGGYPGGYPRPGGIPLPGDEFWPDGDLGRGAVGAANFPIPNGAFNPQAWLTQNPANATIVCWWHDDTVEPGKTYRYRVAYAIKNPVYQLAQFCKDPALAQKFVFQSPFSEWSEKVEMLSTISFWVKSGPRDKSSTEVTFQVFRWEAGDTKTSDFKVSPGDSVGKRESIDFGTGWTLVDLGFDSQNRWYVLLMDSAGHLHRRDSSDTADPRYQKMREQAAASSASASVIP